MAKHCDVCNQDYADNLTACPHCAAAKKPQLAGRGEARATQLAGMDQIQIEESPEPGKMTPSDSEVNLGEVEIDELPSRPRREITISDSASEVNLGQVEMDEWPEQSKVTPADSTVNLGSLEEQPLRPVSEAEFSLGEGAHPGDSGLGVGKFEGPPPSSASNVAWRSLMEETPSTEPAAEQPDLAEKEVDEMLSNLEEAPNTVAAEEPAEVAEDEEAVAEPEAAIEAPLEEEEKPAKAAKPSLNIPALAGTAVLGILIGAGGMMLIRPGEKEKQPAPPSMSQGAPQGMPSAIPQAKAAPSFEIQAARVAGGDWDEAKAAGIEQIQEANPKEIVVRGQYHLGVYLKNVGANIKANDPALHQALQDLQKAAEQNEPNAVYDLALIKELAGQLAEARDEYAKAAQKFANDPSQKQRFESAILRVELKAADKATGASRLPRHGGVEDRAALLALLMVALQQAPAPAPQQPAAQPQQPAAENKEAGFEFWDAVKLARTGKFAEAVSAIDRARKLHDQVRFTRLRKAQNPLSDPAEDIFLRCCDELKMYWRLEKELREGGYLTEKNTPSQALQALVEKAKGGGGAPSKELTDKLAAAQKGQKDAEAKAAGLEKQIDKSKSESARLADELKAAQKTFEERQADFTSAKKQLERLKSDSEAQSSSLKEIRADLIAAKLLDANEKADLGGAVKNLIDVAKAKAKDTPGLLKRPVSLRTPNPFAAEKNFAAGLNFYFDRDYLSAEKSFLLAVENDSQDARFFYFLGLSKAAQDRRRDANADFNQGAQLERLNRPAPAAVDASLERIQGQMRSVVNEYRQSPER